MNTPVPTLPQAGETITHQQAAYFAHVQAMLAKQAAEQSGGDPAATAALAQAARVCAPAELTYGKHPACSFSPLTVGIFWDLQKLGELFPPGSINNIEDLGITIALFSEPERVGEIIARADRDEILALAKCIRSYTREQLDAASAHIAAEVEAFTKVKKPTAAAAPATQTVPSPETTPPPPMAGQ